MTFVSTVIEAARISLEIAGIAIIIGGAVAAGFFALRSLRRGRERAVVFQQFRRHLGNGILLGLEFLVAADIIRSVAVEPTFESVGVLAIIVLVRTFLSFTLEMETTGRWPWEKKEGITQQ